MYPPSMPIIAAPTDRSVGDRQLLDHAHLGQKIEFGPAPRSRHRHPKHARALHLAHQMRRQPAPLFDFVSRGADFRSKRACGVERAGRRRIPGVSHELSLCGTERSPQFKRIGRDNAMNDSPEGGCGGRFGFGVRFSISPLRPGRFGNLSLPRSRSEIALAVTGNSPPLARWCL
jgi:hypothetical protein